VQAVELVRQYVAQAAKVVPECVFYDIGASVGITIA